MKDSMRDSVKDDKTGDKPVHQDGQGTDESPDRAQPELTEENLLREKRQEANDPETRDRLEGELEEMQDDIQNANRK